MNVQINALSDESSLCIEVEPLSSLVIYINDMVSLRELQEYTQAHAVQWKYENEGSYYLLM